MYLSEAATIFGDLNRHQTSSVSHHKNIDMMCDACVIVMVSCNNSRGRIQKQAGKLKSRENKDSIYFTIHAN